MVAPSVRTNKNKPVPKKEKVLDIISIDDYSKPTQANSSTNKDEQQKTKKKNFINEDDDKDETISMPANPQDYYKEESLELTEIKLPRKTESMHIEFNEIDKKIIETVLSEQFGTAISFSKPNISIQIVN